MLYTAATIICLFVTIVQPMPMMMDTEGYPYPQSRGTEGVQLYSGFLDDVIPNYSILTFNDFSDDEKSGDDNAVLEGIWCQNSEEVAGVWYTPYQVPVTKYTGEFGSDHGPGHMHMHHGPDSGKVKNPEVNYYNGSETIFSAEFTSQTVLLRDRDSSVPLSERDEGLYYCNITNQFLVIGLYAMTTYNKNTGPQATDVHVYFPDDDSNEATVVMTFNVSSGPPTYISCTGPGDFEVNQTSMEVKRTVIDEGVTAVAVILNERQEGTIQCNVSNDRVKDGTINGTTATIARTTLVIRKEDSPNVTSVKRVGTGLANYQLSWLGSSTLYGISYTIGELNITKMILGSTSQNSYNASIPLFNIPDLQLNSSFIIEFFVTSYGTSGDASVLPSESSSFPHVHWDYPSLTNLTFSPDKTSIKMGWNQATIEPSSGYIVNVTCQRICDDYLSSIIYTTYLQPVYLQGLFPAIICNISTQGIYGKEEISLSDSKDLRTLYSTPTLPPQNVKVVVVSSQSIEVAWNEVPCSGQNGPIIGYIVEYTKYDELLLNNDDMITWLTFMSNTTSAGIKNLQAYTSYTIKITPLNEAGKGNSSAHLTQATEESEPAEVSDVTSSPLDAMSVLVSWKEPLVIRGVITMYDIRYIYSNITEYILGVNETSYEITGLSQETEYLVGIRAHTIAGPGEWNEISVVLLPEFENITQTTIANIAVHLEWSLPYSESILWIVVQFTNTIDDYVYEIKLSNNSNSLTLPIQQNSLSYNFTIYGVYHIGMKIYNGKQTSFQYNLDISPQTMQCNCTSSGIDVPSEGLQTRNSMISGSIIAAISTLSALVLIAIVIIAILAIIIWRMRNSSTVAFTSSEPVKATRDETYVQMSTSQPGYENLRSSVCEQPDEAKVHEASGVYESIL